MPSRRRLELAARFVAVLHNASRRTPRAWRSVGPVGLAAGITDAAELEQAVADALAGGLIERRGDDPGLVKLTGEGSRLAGGRGKA